MRTAQLGWWGIAALGLACIGDLASPPEALAIEGSRFQPATRGPLGVVASESRDASEVGVAILDSGGNAMDAAVASTFAIAVTQPGQCSLGGGVRVLYRAAHGHTVVIDGGAKTPAAADIETIGSTPGGIDAIGRGHRTVAVPGTVAGLADALLAGGTISLPEAVAGAERLARAGFPVGQELAGQFSFPPSVDRLSLFPQTAAIFLKEGEPYQAGELFVQTDLADTLLAIGTNGAGEFYTGEVGAKIAAEMQQPAAYPGDEGIMTAADLADYVPIRRHALVTKYRGYKIITVPPPMSGVTVIEMLNIMERFDLSSFGPSSADALHVFAEAQKIAGEDTFGVLTDPAFFDVPVKRLTRQRYANRRAAEISLDEAKIYPARVGKGHPFAPNKGGHTTNIAVTDRAGNSADITCTNSALFGSGVVAEGTGVLLNNTMRNAGPPGHPNQMEGGKFLATTIAPTIVVKRGRPLLTLGAGGDAAIMRAIAGVISNVIDFGMDVAQAVDAERFHAYQDASIDLQEVLIEDPRVAPDVVADLEARGHQLFPFGEYACCILAGFVHAVAIDPKTDERLGTVDPRQLEGAAIAQEGPP